MLKQVLAGVILLLAAADAQTRPPHLKDRPGMCTGTGDPHFTTYDGLYYDFQGYGDDCLYIMSELCVPGNLQHFQVLTRHNLCYGGTPANPISCIGYVEVKAFGLTIGVDLAGNVKINGLAVAISQTWSWLTNAVTVSSNPLRISTSFGLIVKVTPVNPIYMNVKITLPAAYGNRVCGICGNFNYQANDDTRTINNFDECNTPGALSWIVPNCACDGKKDPKCWKPCRKHNDLGTIFGGLNRNQLAIARRFFAVAGADAAIRKQGGNFQLKTAALLRNTAFDLERAEFDCDVFETTAEQIPGLNAGWRREMNCTTPCRLKWKDCAELYRNGIKRSGVYVIYPHDGRLPMEVFCDMDTDGGGWTVFQKRLDGSVDFYRGWDDYKRGFGNLSGEFWLGNENLHRLTTINEETYELRVDLEDTKGIKAYAKYASVTVGSEQEKYRLIVGTFSGNAGDSLVAHNGMSFSTKDRDNDTYRTSCAIELKGAWWYVGCHMSNLNGLYRHGSDKTYAYGVTWRTFRGYHNSLKRTSMKIRPVAFQ